GARPVAHAKRGDPVARRGLPGHARQARRLDAVTRTAPREEATVPTSGAPAGPVLVTGGTGSFGSTMVRRLLAAGADEVRVLSRDELKQHEMRMALDDSRVRFL